MDGERPIQIHPASGPPVARRPFEARRSAETDAGLQALSSS
jgi:hypothetical protein